MELRKRRPRPRAFWHLDEMYLKIAGRMSYLWRAVDAEREVVQSKRNKPAALKLTRKLLKKYGFVPERMTIDKLPPCAGAARELRRRKTSSDNSRANNRAENSHQPTRRKEREMQRFKSPDRLRDFSRPTPPSIMFLSPMPSFTETNAPSAPLRSDEDMARGRDRSATSTNSILSSLAQNSGT